MDMEVLFIQKEMFIKMPQGPVTYIPLPGALNFAAGPPAGLGRVLRTPGGSLQLSQSWEVS